VRPSGTEPVIRLYAEGGRLEELVSVASAVVREAIDEAAVDVDDG
jgi:phosphomannomutase